MLGTWRRELTYQSKFGLYMVRSRPHLGNVKSHPLSIVQSLDDVRTVLDGQSFDVIVAIESLKVCFPSLYRYYIPQY